MTGFSHRWRLPAALAFFLVAGFLLRAPQITYGTPVVRDPDSLYTVGAAHRMADSWRRGAPQLDPGAYYYPTFYTNVVALLGTATSTAHMEEKGRFVSVMALVGCIAAAFGLARALAGGGAAILAGAFVSFGFFFVKQGIRPAPDSLQTLAVALSLLVLFKEGPPRMRDAVVSGLLAGAGVGAKYTAIVFVAPALGVLEALRFLQGDRWGALKRAAAWSAAVAAGFAAVSPQFFLYISSFLHFLSLQSRIQASGPLANDGKTFFSLLTSGATSTVEKPFANSLAGMLGAPFIALGVVSLGWAVRRAARFGDPRYAALTAACLASYEFFVVASKVAEVRYLLPTALFLAVLVAAMINDAVQATLRWFGRPWLATAVVAAAVVFALGPSIARDRLYLRMLRMDDARVRGAEWILGHVPAGDKILTLMFSPALPARRYAPVQWVFAEYAFELDLPGIQPPSLERLRAEGIRWVVWSDLYAQRFLDGRVVPAAAAYADGWKTFYSDLNQNSVHRQRFDGRGTIGPTLEIFDMGPEKRA